MAANYRLRMTAIALWLAFLLACGVIVSRTNFTTDLSAFMPRTPTPEQQLLMDQLRDGLASRLILVGIEGADAPTRARLSKQIAQRLRGLVLDPRNLIADIAAGRRQRAQFVDLGVEFGDRLFKIEVAAHGIRH